MPITTQRNGHNKVFTVNIIVYNGYKKHIMAVAKIVCNGHIKTYTGDIKTLMNLIKHVMTVTEYIMANAVDVMIMSPIFKW